MEHNAEGESERDDETDRMLCVDEGKILCPDAWGGICDTDCGYCGGSAYIKAGEYPDGIHDVVNLMYPRNLFHNPYAKVIGIEEGTTHTNGTPSNGEPLIG